MAPSTSHIQAQLRQLIYYHLDNNLLRNALFLAQRLIAYDTNSPEAAYLLSLCQYQSGFVKAAWDSSKKQGLRGTHLGCCYVFAQASLELGRFTDGLSALEKSRHMWQNRNTWNQHNESRRQHLPDAAAVLCLKGKLWKAHKNMDQAVECWATALKLNPFMWDAYSALAESGARVSVTNIYKMSPEMTAMAQMAAMQAQKAENIATMPNDRGSPTSLPLQAQATNQINQNIPDPFASTQKINGSLGNSMFREKLNGSKASVTTASTILDEEAMNTPSTIMDDEPVKPIFDAPPAPVRKARSANEMPADPPPRWKTGTMRSKTKLRNEPEEPPLPQDPAPPAPPTKRTISGQVAPTTLPNGAEPVRRSGRLLNTTRPPSAAGASSKVSSIASSFGLREGRDIRKPRAPVVKGRTATTSTVGRIVSGNRTRIGSADVMEMDGKDQKQNIPPVPPLPNPKVRIESSMDKDLEALRTLLDLFSKMALAQQSLSDYDCQAAIRTYNSLPPNQRDTPYIYAQIGKAYYEQASYADAEKFFIRVRNMAPSRLEDMEVYSTVLWHLKSEIELAYLSHELNELDRLSPQAWCAIGNSFSLQREHEQALKCFRRATQLDPHFAYGFTLQGHEYIANEEFEKALDAYRLAIASDSRHYNAWYGLGKVYEKMGKWSIAEQHYRTAAQINPTNAVLICCIGMVLEKLKDPEQALQMYTRACALAPGNALSRFKKARCLMTLQRPKEALTELKVLKDVAPEEANVWFLMGRLCKMLGKKAEAVRAFTMALNLDPKVCRHFSWKKDMKADVCSRLHNTSRMPWSPWMTTRMVWMTMMKTWIKIQCFLRRYTECSLEFLRRASHKRSGHKHGWRSGPVVWFAASSFSIWNIVA